MLNYKTDAQHLTVKPNQGNGSQEQHLGLLFQLAKNNFKILRYHRSLPITIREVHC